MLLDIILGVLLGILFGLIPSFHINLASYLFLTFSLFLIFPDKFFFFLSLSISQLITSYLPQTFFSVPNVENIMHLFPLHRLFLKGDAYSAIMCAFIGSFFGAIFSILLLPLLFLFFSSLVGFNYFISFVILFVLSSFIFSENKIKDKLIVIFIIVTSGTLGLFTLKYSVGIREPLFVCVVGLFTVPMLLKSIFEKHIKVIQKVKMTISFSKIKSIFLSFIGALSSLFIILVPSLSSSQASTIVSRFKRNFSSKEYIILFSSISISALVFSYFLASYFFKPRLGYVAILLLENQIPFKVDLILFSLTILISVSLTILILKNILTNIIVFINKQNLKSINIIIFFLIFGLVIFISKISALPILFLSSIIGYLPIHYNKSRVILMAYIMIPTLFFYL
jgi:TctA family transporter